MFPDKDTAEAYETSIHANAANELEKNGGIMRLRGGFRYIVYEPVGLLYLGLDGIMHTINGCPLPKLKQLSSLMDVLINIAKNSYQKANDEFSFFELYFHDSMFQQVSHKIVELCGIPLDSIDTRMLSQLLFPYQFNGEEFDGILMQINFPKSASPNYSNKPQEVTEKSSNSWDEMLACLWLSTKSAEEALSVSEKIPWSNLANTMQARNEAFKSDEDKEKESVKQSYKKLAEDMKTTGSKINFDIQPGEI